MSLKQKLIATSKAFKKELTVYTRVFKDTRTPFLGKVFIGLAVGYALMPFDLIPDFIPILGILDDLIIIPLLVFIGCKFIPKELINEIRSTVAVKSSSGGNNER